VVGPKRQLQKAKPRGSGMASLRCPLVGYRFVWFLVFNNGQESVNGGIGRAHYTI